MQILSNLKKPYYCLTLNCPVFFCPFEMTEIGHFTKQVIILLPILLPKNYHKIVTLVY